MQAGGRRRCSPASRSTSRSTSRAACRRSFSGTASTCAQDDERLLVGAAGWLTARTVEQFRTGDHTFFVGEILSIEEGTAATSLSYVHRGYVAL